MASQYPSNCDECEDTKANRCNNYQEDFAGDVCPRPKCNHARSSHAHTPIINPPPPGMIFELILYLIITAVIKLYFSCRSWTDFKKSRQFKTNTSFVSFKKHIMDFYLLQYEPIFYYCHDPEDLFNSRVKVSTPELFNEFICSPYHVIYFHDTSPHNSPAVKNPKNGSIMSSESE